MLGHVAQMKEILTDDGDYIKFLGELAATFSLLYANYSGDGRSRALAEISSLFQVPEFEIDPELFFITADDFMGIDIGALEDFLNEKMGIIGLFIRRVLFKRQLELGIYSSPDEFDENVVLESDGRAKLFTELGALNFFLNGSSMGQVESYFCVEELSVEGVFPDPECTTEMSPDEEVLYDNDHRPLK